MLLINTNFSLALHKHFIHLEKLLHVNLIQAVIVFVMTAHLVTKVTRDFPLEPCSCGTCLLLNHFSKLAFLYSKSVLCQFPPSFIILISCVFICLSILVLSCVFIVFVLLLSRVCVIFDLVQ